MVVKVREHVSHAFTDPRGVFGPVKQKLLPFEEMIRRGYCPILAMEMHRENQTRQSKV